MWTRKRMSFATHRGMSETQTAKTPGQAIMGENYIR